MFQSKFTSSPNERRRERKFGHAGLISPRATIIKQDTIIKQATIMIFEDEYEIISAADIKAIEFTSDSNVHDIDTKFYVKFFYDAIKKILNCRTFNEELLRKRKLYLCEAYVLLWQYISRIDLKSTELKVGVLAAVLLDLQAHRKIKIVENENQLKSHNRSSELYVTVIDDEPTFTFMDRVLFQKMLRHADITHKKPRKLSDWLASSEETCVVSLCLKNLVSRGILSNTNGMSALKYSLINIGPVQQLEKEIKGISLKERMPDTFILAILTLSFNTDNNFLEQLLDKICSRRETKVAMANVKTIVNTQGLVLKSPKFVRKKFSMDKPHYVTNGRKNTIPLSPIPGSPDSLQGPMF